MNIIKHMEAVFIVTVVTLGSAALLADGLPAANARPQGAAPVIAAPADAAVVVVSAKRMTPEEKRASLQQERIAAGRG